MRDNFGFRHLLLEYYFILSSSQSKFEHKLMDEDTLDERLYVNLEWFHYLRSQLFKEEEVFKVIKDRRILNKKMFLLPEKQRCPGCDDGRPFKIIRYRNIDIPVYDDDYGQQDFAVINGEEISGGSYNFFAHEEFMNYVDRMLEKKYLEDDYNMHYEIIKLFPEWKEKDK